MLYGENIKSARKAVGLTQTQLAEKCGLATVTIGQYERNVREPRAEQLQKIADALGVNPLELLGFSEKTEYDFEIDVKADLSLLAENISKKYGISLKVSQNIIDDCYRCIKLEGERIEVNTTLGKLFAGLPLDVQQEAIRYAQYLLHTSDGRE